MKTILRAILFVFITLLLIAYPHNPTSAQVVWPR